jgi:hypothetical protein
MNKRQRTRTAGQPASDLLESAVHLLRATPVSVLVLHPLGSVPCLLGVLYFFAEMSRSAFAAERLVGWSLALAALYVWMKSWQALFAARLRARLLREDAPERWSAGRVARLVAGQAMLQSIGLLVRPVALVVGLPYVWVATYFHNVTVLGDGTPPGVRELSRRAWSQARLWPWQAHVLASMLFVFGTFVWLNAAIFFLSLPSLLKMFLGIETVFSRHFLGMLTPLFFLSVFAATYLCLDPLRKAVIVLRCFHGSSLHTGADLEVRFRALRTPLAQAALAILLCCSPLGARAEAPPVEPARLNESIERVLERREFAWRAPREKRREFTKDLPWLARWWRDVERWFKRNIRRFLNWLFPDGEPAAKTGWSLDSVARPAIWILLVVAGVWLLVLIVRQRRARAAAIVAQAVTARPDLTQEDVSAELLPEDGWLQMARELMDRGELRLALRASYLAGLAHLGHRELLQLARHKSNRDYDRELRRRARTQPDLLASFGDTLRAFERSWYGDHEVTRETLGDFSRHLERIRAC